MSSNESYYVYCLFRPWNGEPCYIGKGRGDRMYRHETDHKKHRNSHLARIITKAGCELPKVVLHENLDEKTAFIYEITLIAAIGRERKGGPLVNQTDGGEGPSGMVLSDEAKRKVGEASRKYWEEPEFRQKMSESVKKSWENEERRKETSNKTKNMWADPDKKEAIKKSFRESWTKERRQKHGKIIKETRSCPELKEKISESSKAMWAARSDEQRSQDVERLQKQALEQWQNQEHIDNMKLKAKAREAEPEFKAWRKEAAKNQWASLTPEQREVRKEALRAGQARRRAREREEIQTTLEHN